jgi:esterase
LDLFFREYGQGHPLTILHGLFGAGGNWHTMSRSVFADLRHVVVPDLRNHGQSPHSSRMDYESMASDVEEVWDRLNLPASDVVGHSMGGKVAMQLALTLPDRVSRLVVVDIAPRSYPPRHVDIIEALRGARPADKASRSEVENALSLYIPNHAVRQFLLKNLRRTTTGSYEWMVSLDDIEASYDRISGGLSALSTYDGPALFIRGGLSDYIQDDDYEVIRAYFPAAEVATIPKASHWVHADAKDAFAELVSEFLQR